MNTPDEIISATSNGTRTAIVMLTDFKAIEKKNPEIERMVQKRLFDVQISKKIHFSICVHLPQTIEMFITITEIAAVIPNA